MAKKKKSNTINKKKIKSSKKGIKFNPNSSDIQKHGTLYYAIPGRLQKEIRRLDYSFDFKSMAITYAAIVMLMMAAGFVFKLPFLWQLPLMIAGIMFAPVLIFNMYRNRYEKKRFSDVNVYVEQMLYAFKNSQKILTALEDVRILFPKGRMRTVLDQACDIISDPTASKNHDDVEEYALSVISECYHNQHIEDIHRFMLKVENIGGDFDSSIGLLLDSRGMWEDRTYFLRDKKAMKKSQIAVSCLMSLGLCAFMLYILPANVDLAANPLVRLGNIMVIIICMMIYIKGDSKLSSSLIAPRKERGVAATMAAYNRYIHYDSKKEMVKSLIWCVVPIIIILIGRFIVHNTLVSIFGVVLLPLMLTQHMLGHALAGKTLRREIGLAFPQWLMELALLLQADNVQVSINKTVDNAAAIMTPELKRLRETLLDHPDSSEPFLNFFYQFQMPEITTAMQMLYGLSSGSGGAPAEQIANIVSRNNVILDRAEKVANDNSMAGLMTLFLAPALLGAVVLMLDMSLFLFQFMSTMSA